MIQLPPIETVAADIHDAWMAQKRAQGITSRKSETGEELMVPYDQLSEPAKELDRAGVRAVYAAIQRQVSAWELREEIKETLALAMGRDNAVDLVARFEQAIRNGESIQAQQNVFGQNAACTCAVNTGDLNSIMSQCPVHGRRGPGGYTRSS